MIGLELLVVKSVSWLAQKKYHNVLSDDVNECVQMSERAYRGVNVHAPACRTHHLSVQQAKLLVVRVPGIWHLGQMVQMWVEGTRTKW
jgi:hypothetical protein